MPAALKLLKNSIRSERLAILVKALNLSDIQIEYVDEAPEFIYTNEGVQLNDVNEIMKVLSQSTSFEVSDAEKAQKWIEFNSIFEILTCVLTYSIRGLIPKEDIPIMAEKKARADVMKNMRTIELQLKETKYLLGDQLSYIDIMIATTLRPLFQYILAENERSNLAMTSAFIQELTSQSSFIDVVGETVFYVDPKKNKN